MPTRKTPEPPASELTPEPLYMRRREWLKNAALTAGTAAATASGLMLLLDGADRPARAPATPPPPLPVPVTEDGAAPSIPRTFDVPGEAQTSLRSITTYNNFYELGLDKEDPARNAGSLRLRPWTIEIAGEVKQPRTLDLETLLRWFPLEERVYRMRCVEAWSMVIPWLGFPLRALLDKLEPTSKAKFVVFTTLLDPEQLPGQGKDVLDWPYVEALRIDEAAHPLTMLAVGLYGDALLGQNGAPLRLVVPWKYGFKGIKSIVKIELSSSPPMTTWNLAAPDEYGFYANVNPEVDHPRWSQRTERRIGDLERRMTLPFNGYGAEVASLYSGLDLRRYF